MTSDVFVDVACCDFQVRSALFGMAFLHHRFSAAQLPPPRTETVATAAKRLEDAYGAATAEHCKGIAN